MTAVQNSSKPSEMGMTTSAVNLIRSVGATIGTAVFAMLIGNKINGELYSLLPPDIYAAVPHSTGVLDLLVPDATGLPGIASVMLQIGYLPAQLVTEVPKVVNEILLAFANSVDFAFIAGGCLILVLVVIGIIFKVERPKDVDNEVLIPETEE
jgi:hypothetical protein